MARLRVPELALRINNELFLYVLAVRCAWRMPDNEIKSG